MKLFLLLCIAGIQLNAQVIFCPPGSEWRYSFIQYYQYAVVNEKITYEGYSLSGSDTIKTLKHAQLFKNNSSPSGWAYTHIRQHGDTIFFKNARTQNTWQTLYNFNVSSGHSWQTNYSFKTYTFVVNSVTTVTVNGFSLKKISGYYSYAGGDPYTVSITERFGCNEFLFDFAFGNSTDSYFFQNNLCYKDSVFGSIQFSNKPCDFADYVGLEEQRNNLSLRVFPNPTSGRVTFKNENYPVKSLELRNTLGELVFRQAEPLNEVLDLEFLPAGVYFLLAGNGVTADAIKIIKN